MVLCNVNCLQYFFHRKRVGEGSFGEVWRAQAEGILGRPGMQAVAVKMPKGRIG